MEAEEREAKSRELAAAYAERLRRSWPQGTMDITRLEEISGGGARLILRQQPSQRDASQPAARAGQHLAP